MKHTPGPWEYDGEDFYRLDDKGTQVEAVLRADCTQNIGYLEVSEADARLIATAPDMLEFVEWMSKGYGVPVGMQERAVALLKRIEGAE